jgi:hypothetical protein
MKPYEKAVLAGFCILLVLVLAAYLLTGGWAAYFQQSRNAQSLTGSNLVDMRPLTTAQTLALLAATSSEREYAQDALRLGDHSVDLSFAAALRDTTQNPPPPGSQTQALAQRVTTASAAVKADQDRVAALTQPGKAPEKAKDGDQEQLGLEQAQLALDQDELQDAQQDLIRAGGDKQAAIQQLLDQHEASEAHSTASHAMGATDTTSIELTRAANIASEVGAWLSLRSKEQQLAQAQQQALARAAKFSASHDALEKKLAEEDAQNKVFHPVASSPSPATSAKPAKNSMAMKYAMAFLHQMRPAESFRL